MEIDRLEPLSVAPFLSPFFLVTFDVFVFEQEVAFLDTMTDSWEAGHSCGIGILHRMG